MVRAAACFTYVPMRATDRTMRREQLTVVSVVAAIVLIACVALLWPPSTPGAPPEASSSEFSDTQDGMGQQAPVPEFDRTPAQPASIDRGTNREEPVGDGASPLAPSLQRQVGCPPKSRPTGEPWISVLLMLNSAFRAWVMKLLALGVRVLHKANKNLTRTQSHFVVMDRI